MRDTSDPILEEAEKCMPEYLYRYQPPKLNRVREVVVNSRLYFSKPPDFNDPFDCRVEFDWSGTPREWNKRLKKLIKKIRPKLKRQEREKVVVQWMRGGRYKSLYEVDINPILNSMGVLSLTKKRDNLLMWSHYAAGHAGVCLEFRCLADDPLFGTAWPVQYQTQYPLYRYVDVDVEKVIIELLVTKAKDWKYEQEWRVIGHPGGFINGPGKHPFPPHLLTGVIFGCRAEENFKEQVRKMASGRINPPQLYQAVKKNNDFGLDIVPETSDT